MLYYQLALCYKLLYLQMQFVRSH